MITTNETDPLDLYDSIESNDGLNDQNDNEMVTKEESLWQQKKVIIPGSILISGVSGVLGWFAHGKFFKGKSDKIIKDKAKKDRKSSTESNFYELFDQEINYLDINFEQISNIIKNKKKTTTITAEDKAFNKELDKLIDEVSAIAMNLSDEIEKGKILKDKIYDTRNIIKRVQFLNSNKISGIKDLNIYFHANHLLVLIDSIECKLGENIITETKTFFKEIKTQYTVEKIKEINENAQKEELDKIEYLITILKKLDVKSYNKDTHTIILKCTELMKKHKEKQSSHQDLKDFIDSILEVSKIEEIIKSNTEAIFLNKIDILLQFLNDNDVILKLSEQNACTLIISFIELQEKKLQDKKIKHSDTVDKITKAIKEKKTEEKIQEIKKLLEAINNPKAKK